MGWALLIFLLLSVQSSAVAGGMTATVPLISLGRSETAEEDHVMESVFHLSAGDAEASSFHLRGMLLNKQGKVEEADEMFRQSWGKEAEFLGLLSLRELLWSYFGEGRWMDILSYTAAEASILQYRDFFYLHAEALYRTHQYDQLLRVLVPLVRESLQDLPWNRIETNLFRKELQLWSIIAMLQLDLQEWKALLEKFVLEEDASFHHTRLYFYFQHRESLLRAPLMDLLEIRHMTATGEHEKVIDAFQRFEGPYTMLSRTIVHELRYVARRTKKSLKGAEILQKLLGAARVTHVLEYIGRLYLDAEYFEQAADFLARSLHATETASLEYRRRQWYLFITTIRSHPLQAYSKLAALQDSMEQHPRYFTDAFDELLQVLLEMGNWHHIAQIFQYLLHWGSDTSKAQYALALSQIHDGSMQTDLFQSAYQQTESLYYHALAAFFLKHPLQLEIRDPSPDFILEGTEFDEPLQLIQSYIDAHLISYAVQVFKAQAETLSRMQLYATADLLIQVDEAYVVLSVLAAYVDFHDMGFLRRYYPRVFQHLFSAAAEESRVDSLVLFALAREESRFSTDARSTASAQGLMQLIPDTAHEVAQDMRIQNPVLTNPADNIRIGAQYFSKLSHRWEAISLVIAAYNAGPGRLRQWERSIPYAGFLFIEAIPFRETRNHVRKVFTSSMYYSLLYGEFHLPSFMQYYFSMEGMAP